LHSNGAERMSRGSNTTTVGAGLPITTTFAGEPALRIKYNTTKKIKKMVLFL